MKINLLPTRVWLSITLVLSLLLGSSRPGRAQSGPYGFEWIVPGQQYVKIKVWRDGVYHLDQQYLVKTGLPTADPQRLQLWRRGREVAVYLGGNTSTLDATTYLEFYGQRNDGALDAEYYKNPAEQPHQLYSFDTDTAAYFLTYGAQPGRRMVEAAPTTGNLNPYRLVSSLKLHTERYKEVSGTVFQSWLEGGEGFMGTEYSGGSAYERLDSVLRDMLPTPVPRIEGVLSSGSMFGHHIRILIYSPTDAERDAGTVMFTGHEPGRFRVPLQTSDFTTSGNVGVRFGVVATADVPKDNFRVTYYRVIAAQPNRWYSNRRYLWFQNDSTLNQPDQGAAFEVEDAPATVVGYDVQDPWNVQRIVGTVGTGTTRRFVFPTAAGQQTRRLLLADLARPDAPGLPPRPVKFRTMDPAKPNYIIITHPKLLGPAGGAPNAARAYADYRASAAGGGHDTLLVLTPQLYDQFHYGERSVLALRHFVLWIADHPPAGQIQARYLLLLGKAIAPGEPLIEGSRFKNIYTSTLTRTLGEYGEDLVPISTRAESDNFLSADWPHDDYVARLPTGRVIAKTPQEVMDYLGKLKQYEKPDPDLADWHKRALNLVGGEKPEEQARFEGYLAAYKRRIERPPFGGRVVATYRRSEYPTNGGFPVEIDISPQLNAGLALISYFGHASVTTFDVTPGSVAKYNNKDKYPILFLNGCDAALLFTNSPTFGQEWIMAPERGAIGLMGQSSLGFEYPLHLAQDLHYKLLLNDSVWYGKSIAVTYAEVVRRLQHDKNFTAIGEDIASSQMLATMWHGDPALTIFSPSKPDFIASAARLSIAPASGQPGPVEAVTPNFVLNIGVSNPGKVTSDFLEIQVTRTYSSNRKPTVYRQRFRQAFQRDTTYAFALTNEGNVFGQNTFEVSLDYANKVAELSETNNTAQLTFSFLQAGITLLSPPEFAIVPTNAPLLVAQTNDPASPVRAYAFELDTVPTFNSRLLQQHTSDGALTADWQPTLPAIVGRDSAVWYWRVRFAVPGTEEEKRWVQSSFRFIPGSPGGWSQSHYAQFQRDGRQGVDVSAPGGRWSFAEEKYGLTLRTVGGGPAGPAGALTFSTNGQFGIFRDPSASPYVVNCAVNAPGLLVAVYDQRTLLPLSVAGGPYLTCGPTNQPYYIFGANPTSAADTLNNLNNSAARQAELVSLLTNVPDGAYVALVSMNRLRYAALPASVRTALSSLLGSQLIGQNRLLNGDPFALLAQKRANGGRLLHEAGPDLAAGAPPRNAQLLSVSDTLRTVGTRGTVVSTRIGPAQQWGTLYHAIRTETPTGTYTLRLLGIGADGHADVLNANVTAPVQDVSTVSAANYPYLQLELSLRDTENRVPPQLRQWLVTYSGVPEGVVRRDLAPAGIYEVAALTKQATDTGFLSFPVVFKNVSGLSFGAPLLARVSLRNETGTEVRSIDLMAPGALAPGATATFPVRLDVKGIFGTLTAQVEVNPLLKNPSLQPELYHFNNLLTLPPITIIDRNVPPVLDVAFDGRRILSGELVSPTPIIRIQLRDEDQVRHISDVRYFTVQMQGAKDATPRPIDLKTSSEISFRADSTSRPGTTATLEFLPGKNGPLPDGVYTLFVQGRDPSNASAGRQDYEVKFEVVNESTITNVFPYPNPVTSKARFVFTVTGQELPRNMKIMIMTLTGKVVREIFMNELGPLHIGNNLTDFAWDGTDQYGDRLANGTYLYRVTLDEPVGTFGRRATAGDKAFKNDWGKLVLLR